MYVVGRRVRTGPTTIILAIIRWRRTVAACVFRNEQSGFGRWLARGMPLRAQEASQGELVAFGQP